MYLSICMKPGNEHTFFWKLLLLYKCWCAKSFGSAAACCSRRNNLRACQERTSSISFAILNVSLHRRDVSDLKTIVVFVSQWDLRVTWVSKIFDSQWQLKTLIKWLMFWYTAQHLLMVSEVGKTTVKLIFGLQKSVPTIVLWIWTINIKNREELNNKLWQIALKNRICGTDEQRKVRARWVRSLWKATYLLNVVTCKMIFKKNSYML